MKTYTVEENNRTLEAWNEWKSVCSILKCSKENSLLLAKLVGNSFREKLARVIHNPHPVDDIQTCAHEFDTGIIEMATNPGIDKRTGRERTKKNYKDVAWQKCEESNDAPLKVIHGALIGPLGIINDIVESYVEKEYGYDWRNEAGKRFLVHHQSINAPVDGNDGSSIEWGDFINELCTPPEELDDSELELIDEEVNNYTLQEAAVFLASLVKLSLADQTLLNLIQLEKTQSYKINEENKVKLRIFLQENFIPDLHVKVLRQMKNRIILKLAAEKRASEFLLVVETKMSENK